jgi:hypothetical protein
MNEIASFTLPQRDEVSVRVFDDGRICIQQLRIDDVTYPICLHASDLLKFTNILEAARQAASQTPREDAAE